MTRINVTKTFLPPIEEYESYLKKIWQSGHITNRGPLLREFEQKTAEYLDVPHFQFVTNGTLALQIALRALDITEGEIITTPFSYVATTSAILWERCAPVYVDIDPSTLNIDPYKIEQAITKKTKAIMPVHVFGNPCDTKSIETIAKKHSLKVIYDAAHAFGVKQNNQSIMTRGDITMGSFHATKPFHTIEGGCVISRDKSVDKKADLLKRFGHTHDEHYMLGINAKASDFQAAMGLCNLEHIDEIIQARKRASLLYDRLLDGRFERPKTPSDVEYNYAYYPILFENQGLMEEALKKLENQDIYPRRYFYPSLNTLPYLEDSQSCPISEDISTRILCLPLYAGIENETIEKVCRTIK